MTQSAHSQGEDRPISAFAIASLAAAVVGPLLGFLTYGIAGAIAVACLVLLTILLVRSLFMSPARAGVLIAGLSLATVATAITILLSVFPTLAGMVNQMREARGCDDSSGSAWCVIPKVPAPTSIDLWLMAGVLIAAVLILNFIWFGRTGLLPGVVQGAPDGRQSDLRGESILGRVGGDVPLSPEEIDQLRASIRTSSLTVTQVGNSTEASRHEIRLGSAREADVKRALRAGLMAPRQAPSSPPDFQGRGDLIDRLSAELLSGRPALIGAIRGMGGIGKTALACYLADRLEVAFPDGTLWINGRGTQPGSRPSADDTIGRILHALDPLARLPQAVDDRRSMYRSSLRDRKCLIIFDDAADGEIPAMLVPPQPSALLVTSRRTFVLPGLLGVDLPPLPLQDARQLVSAVLSTAGRHLAITEIDELVSRCAGLPLALRAGAAFLAENPGWQTRDYLDRLSDDRARLDALRPESLELDVRVVLGFSYDRLEEDNALLAEQWRFLSLIPASFDEAAAAAIWDCSLDNARLGLALLQRRTLLEYDSATARYRFHDLMRDLATEKLAAHDEAPI